MFTFLNSIILSALFAAFIPILIHLFNKQKTKKIKFSSLRFLKKMEKRRLKKVKIYQILLIIIRTLLIVLLVLAFARPTFSGAWSILQEPSANTTAVIILDDGLSMRSYDSNGNRFNRAKVKLNQVLNSFSASDRIKIIKTSNSEAEILDSTEVNLQDCSFEIADINSALVEANKHFDENPNFNKELHIISDFQTMQKEFQQYAKVNEDINIYLAKIYKTGTGNVSIDKIEFDNSLFEINKPINMKIQLKNQSNSETMSVNSHVFINEKRLAQNNTVVPASETQIIPVTFTPKMYGWNIGYVEIDDDDLLADNRYYFSINIQKTAKVLWVDGNASSYLKSAIETINKSANIEIQGENYNTLARQSFNNYDVLFLSNLPELTDAIISRIQAFIKNGKGIILVPGEKIVPASFNATLGPVLGNLKIVGLKEVENSESYFSLREIKLNNPLLSNLFETENPEISIPTFKKYFILKGKEEYESLMQFTDGNPFLLQSNQKDLKSLVLSSYFDDSWSNIQYKGIFLPLLVKMIKYSAFKMDVNKNQVLVGKEVLYTTTRGNGINEFYMVLPNSEKVKISPVYSGKDLTFDLQSLNVPGNYKILQDSEILSVISANVNTKNLDGSLINLDDIVAENDNIQLINEEDNVNEKVMQARFGEEIWKYVVALALLILLLESFVVKKIEGKI